MSPLGTLLHAVAAGDRDAFATLYDRCQVAVWEWCGDAHRDRAAREAAFRRAMVDLWRSAPSFPPSGLPPMAWVRWTVNRSLAPTTPLVTRAVPEAAPRAVPAVEAAPAP